MNLILLVALASVSFPGTFSAPLNSSLDEAWMQWKAEFTKVYKEGEEEYRRSVWEKNMKMIEQHNREYAEGKHTFEMGMNDFGDMTDEEFQQQMGGCDLDLEPQDDNVTFHEVPIGQTLPKNVNWTEKGLVTSVKKQGDCGSCWAFSVAGALEALHARKTGKLFSLSAQNLIDCVKGSGCEGGSRLAALKYVKNNRGINRESTYPYEERKGLCRFNPRDRAAFCNDVKICPPNEKVLMHAVASVGPVTAGITSLKQNFYRKGYITHRDCSNGKLKHSILLVGYKTEANGKKYWYFKNSWGVKWGIRGYGWLEMGSNACKVANKALYPI